MFIIAVAVVLCAIFVVWQFVERDVVDDPS